MSTTLNEEDRMKKAAESRQRRLERKKAQQQAIKTGVWDRCLYRVPGKERYCAQLRFVLTITDHDLACIAPTFGVKFLHPLIDLSTGMVGSMRLRYFPMHTVSLILAQGQSPMLPPL